MSERPGPCMSSRRLPFGPHRTPGLLPLPLLALGEVYHGISRDGDVQSATGFAVQPRWDGAGAPPLHRAPPLSGSMVLETAHPFHFKLCPAIMLGPKCNHDVGVLLWLLLLTPEQL